MAFLNEQNLGPNPNALQIYKACGSCIINSDNYGIRNGYVLQKFNNEQDIYSQFKNIFNVQAIGLLKDDYWGHHVNMYLVVAKV